MPTDDDYGRSRHQTTSAPYGAGAQCQSPARAAHCPVGCPPGADKHHHPDPPGFAADRLFAADRPPAGDRYPPVSERYPLGDRPPTALAAGKEPDRYAARFDRYHSDRYPRTGKEPDGGYAAKSPPKDCKQELYHGRYERYAGGGGGDRFPAIPCPERFATQERLERPEKMPFSQVSYLEPPSPAPASDRFFPPPPLSPANTPSPDCFSNNTFPSPTATAPPSERFVPPPPLSPSPTEAYERYDKLHRYQGYSSSPNIPSADRSAHNNDTRYKERYGHNYSDRYQQQGNQQNYQNDKYVTNDGRFINDRYVPPNAHMPVERYVPQPQEPYFANYQNYGYKTFNNSDPYMRRDLAFHYRLPIPYSNNYQRIRFTGTPGRFKCCQFQDGYQMCKSSPGSSSSSSVTSQKEAASASASACSSDVQCQSYHGNKEYFQQEKAVQCAKGACRHGVCASPSVEYVGASGGRHVCATPPPPPKGAGGADGGGACNENCYPRRSQSTLTVTVWRGAPQAANPAAQTPKHQERALTPPAPKPVQRPATPSAQPEPPQKQESGDYAENAPVKSPQMGGSPPVRTPVHQRAVSMPVATPADRPRPAAHQQQSRPVNYSQSERIPNRERPALNRTLSRKEMIKKYIRKETANFFGVDEDNENEQQLRWLDRRKRMACRTMGPLKEEYCTPSISRFSQSHRRTLSEMAQSAQSAHVGSGQLTTERPDVLPGPSDLPDAGVSPPEAVRSEPSIRRKDSVARMTWDGLSYVVTTLTRNRPRPRSQSSHWSRSYPPDTPSAASSPEEQSFFEKPVAPASPRAPEGGGDTIDKAEAAALPPYRERERVRYADVPSNAGWRIDQHEVILRHGERRSNGARGSRIPTSTLDRVLDNSDRRQYGMGWVGRMFGHSFRKSVTQDAKVREQLDDMEDHRPMFTYWVTTVQILVLFISIVCYGIGPYGIDLQSRSGQVLVTSLSLQQVDYMEPANFWLGPRAADLIHLGAKFAPCMRLDDKIKKEIDKIQAKERETACCIRNDDSGCVQSSQADCSLRGLRPTKTISTWKKWKMGDSGPGGRISGSVCGLDPKFCDAPASVHPYEWPDDITKWPICRKTNTQFSVQKNGNAPRDKLAEHMVCEVIGHPCCIGIHGQCKITTKEYCDFVRGAFHEEASLCSQVSCLNDVCGMIPFYFPDAPDQFYRLWTSLFLHAGVLQLLITVLIQYFLMRDLEKLTGSLRIGIVYIGSGVAGNLASAIFVPYRADVGPSGSQFGLLACLIVEVLNAWPMLKHPNQALCKLLSITLVLFAVGLLPWVDNYAHLFGFAFGFLLSYAFLPFVSFGKYDRHKKVFLIWVCLAVAWVLFILLVLLFYIIPVYDCEVCSYFNCLPVTRDFCASQNINFKREEPIV
ncbi:unnamed protein product [Phyllotreta striolata]|uniref:Peptidase S54 rhomboid domain-containing protein n=1 Tax=Phyllotreta striolata TaxID=444603 RepID=A0A9N9TZB5_PHYSR|nr:unnamed protein product [Phyllotreta striolata]